MNTSIKPYIDSLISEGKKSNSQNLWQDMRKMGGRKLTLSHLQWQPEGMPSQ